MSTCAHCPRKVPATSAAVCRRALSGLVLCWRCRRQHAPSFTSPHQSPAGCTETLQPSGYGRYLAQLTTPAGTFTGSGLTEELALSRARSAARAAGVLL